MAIANGSRARGIETHIALLALVLCEVSDFGEVLLKVGIKGFLSSLGATLMELAHGVTLTLGFLLLTLILGSEAGRYLTLDKLSDSLSNSHNSTSFLTVKGVTLY